MGTEPTRCNHPACGQWTWGEYCQNHAPVIESLPNLRGIGIVTPPSKVRVTKPRRIADGHDARPAKDRASIRPYSGLRFASDVYRDGGQSSATAPKPKATPKATPSKISRHHY